MPPVRPDDLEIEVDAVDATLRVKVYPSGPVGIEPTDESGGAIMLARDVWTTIESHAAVAAVGETIHLENATIGTDVTVLEDGIRIEQSGGLDVVTLSEEAVKRISSHVEETRFALQSSGYDPNSPM